MPLSTQGIAEFEIVGDDVVNLLEHHPNPAGDVRRRDIMPNEPISCFTWS